MESIGVRELRQHASRWLHRVARGESFQVTDRGRPVAVLSPVVEGDWERLVSTGQITPATHRLADVVPMTAAGGRTLSEILAEDREER
jgi:prevent-host-death family protein